MRPNHPLVLALVTLCLGGLPPRPAAAIEALLIQDSYPWGSNAWQAELDDQGIPYTQLNSANLVNTNLELYDIVITSSVQGGTYNQLMMNAHAQFEAFVIDGGVLFFSGGALDNQSPVADPPFGGTTVYQGVFINNLEDPTHPIMDNVPATLWGYGNQYLSHTYFYDLPVGVHVLASQYWQNGNPEEVTMYEFDQGLGELIVSSLSLEWGYYNHPYGQHYGNILPDFVAWAAELACDKDDDGFQSLDCGGDDCDDRDPDVHVQAAEVLNGIDDDCDDYVDEGLLTEGDLFITEIMKDPAAVADDDGEWFEITNASAYDINLAGAVLLDLDGDWATVATDVWISPGEYAVLAADADPLINGGVDVDYAYGDGWYLSNTDDEIVINHHGVELDRVVYADPDWPDGEGQSMSLDPNHHDAAANDDSTHWCAGADSFGDGDLGTPGGANPICCVDGDGDGHGDLACGGDDCDDGDADIHPGADEYCNGVDDDCDATVDEDDALDAGTWYADTDQDSYGDAAVSEVDCAQPAGYVANGTDCDDGDPHQHPGAVEVCNGEDDDCDGATDEDDALDAQTWYADTDQDTYGEPAVTEIA